MHPQLDKNRFDTCEKLMDALEECHRQEFMKSVLGMCNFEKDELTKCLHYTRINDAAERIEKSKIRQKKFAEMRKRADEETYGKNNYLKKMIEKEAEKKLQEQQK
ncbi:cytochrome c oxidase biogenesis protein Cmc1 like-domain-containing protein [Scheffersomyces amazonensis]|uniref:cytochrome c oxidase biogenesis protein Cmc1 like-domain-containing protein n=1 Tax=Scheffersomyces amazonensis TaxID=1078765 RepID=UPI00315D8B45